MKIKKLKGKVNYKNWAFAAENYLSLKGLDDCIQSEQGTPGVAIEVDAEKLKKAKTLLVLLVEESQFRHIKSCKTALEIWNVLKTQYEDKKLDNKIGLLRHLISIRLANHASMETYINDVIDTAESLHNIDFELSDLWIGIILLAGLTDDYHSFILGIEASGAEITGEYIMTKLRSSSVDAPDSSSKAFKANKKFNSNSENSQSNSRQPGGEKNRGKPKRKHKNHQNQSANNASNNVVDKHS